MCGCVAVTTRTFMIRMAYYVWLSRSVSQQKPVVYFTLSFLNWLYMCSPSTELVMIHVRGGFHSYAYRGLRVLETWLSPSVTLVYICVDVMK